MPLTVHTANTGLLQTRIHSSGYGSPVIPVALDESLRTDQWALYDDQTKVAGPFRIREQMCEDIRRRMGKVQVGISGSRAHKAAHASANQSIIGGIKTLKPGTKEHKFPRQMSFLDMLSD